MSQPILRPQRAAAKQIQKLNLQSSIGFVLFVVVQRFLVWSGIFGSTPVIPVAFFCCVDILIAIVVFSLVSFGLILQVLARRLYLSVWLSAAFFALAIWLGFGMVSGL